MKHASGHGKSILNLKGDGEDVHITMPNPIVRSMRPAIIGTIAARDSSAMIPLSLRIERALIAVGNESGAAPRRRRSAGRSGSAGRKPAELGRSPGRG